MLYCYATQTNSIGESIPMRTEIVDYLEAFYADRMMELFSTDSYEDAHAIYTEFVVNQQEPEDYFYLEYLSE